MVRFIFLFFLQAASARFPFSLYISVWKSYLDNSWRRFELHQVCYRQRGVFKWRFRVGVTFVTALGASTGQDLGLYSIFGK